MKITKLAKNMTELEYQDGMRVLVSYETPVAAFIPETIATPLGPSTRTNYWRTRRWISESTNRHIKEWLRVNGAVDDVATVEQDVIENLMRCR